MRSPGKANVAFLLCQVGVFKERGVVTSGCEDDVDTSSTIYIVHHLAQHLTIVAVILDEVVAEGLGRCLAGHRAGYHRITGSRGNAQVVFQDEPTSVLGLHQVYAGYVGIDVAGGCDALTLGHVPLALVGELLGYDPIFYDVLLVVDIVEEGIQCLDTLHQSLLQHRPLLSGYLTGYGVEGKQLFVEHTMLIYSKPHSKPFHPTVHRLSC